MVALVQRVRKLGKNVADRSQIGRLDNRVVYQPSADELIGAVAISVERRVAWKIFICLASIEPDPVAATIGDERVVVSVAI